MHLIKDYEFFLQGMLREVFEITQSPEYWKMREENIRNSNITQREPPEAPNLSGKQEDLANDGGGRNMDIPPPNDNLEKCTQDGTPTLRKWNGGKYICKSLPAFIVEYSKKWDDLTQDVIRHYLIYEGTRQAFAQSTINQQMKQYGPGRRPKVKKVIE
jgi:hypothetical protein